MSFGNWYRRNQSEITWWLIGWLSFGLIDCLLRGSWGYAFLNAILIVLNYKLWTK